MQANSPSSYAASLALHALVTAMLFALTWWFSRVQEAPPVIFELVAGAPTDMNATEAGSAAPKLDLELPKIKPLDPEITRPRPEPEVVTPPKQEIKTPPKQEPKKAEPRKVAQPKQVSYDQFVKEHGKPQPKQVTQSTRPIRTPRLNTNDIVRDLVKGGQGGTALTRPEQDVLANYIAQLIRALQLAHEKPPGLGDQLEAQITFNIAANGDISNVRITRSSGDRDFDQSALDAFGRVRSIGPTPNRKADTWTIRFRVRED